MLVPFDHLAQQRDPLLCRNVRKSNQPRMRNPFLVDELPEIGIDRYKYPAFGLCKFQQRTISGIWTEKTCFECIKPCIAEPFRQTPAGTPVNEKLHYCCTDTAASVSPAITACA